MSIYAQLDTGEQDQFATTKGWGEVGRWIDALDSDTYPQLVHLREFGWSQQVVKLNEELARSVKSDPPDSQDVLSVVKRLTDFLGVAPEGAEVLTITDGLTVNDAPQT